MSLTSCAALLFFDFALDGVLTGVGLPLLGHCTGRVMAAYSFPDNLHSMDYWLDASRTYCWNRYAEKLYSINFANS